MKYHRLNKIANTFIIRADTQQFFFFNKLSFLEFGYN